MNPAKVTAEGAPPALSETRLHRLHASEQVNVLLLDDCHEHLQNTSRLLRRVVEWRAKVAACSDLRAARAALAERSIDVLLIDLQVGGRSGIEIYGTLRDEGLEGPAILLTDRGDEQVVTEAMRAGFADYLPKGVLKTSVLERSIRNAVEKQRLKMQLAQRRRELEGMVEDLRARNEEIQSFYHTLSHELKTPLTATREFIALVMDGIAGPLVERQREFLEVAQRNCDQMVTCMNDILDASRLDTGKLTINPCSFSVWDVVERARASIAHRASAKEVSLTAQCELESTSAWIDEQRIFQVVTNLLSNAIKFTPTGGRVEVLVDDHPRRDALRVRVRDEGRGIPPEALGRVFERLYQTREEDSSTSGGLGLGLFLCRQLVRVHGGEIWVESELGRGSCFTFWLPREAHPPAATSTPP